MWLCCWKRSKLKHHWISYVKFCCILSKHTASNIIPLLDSSESVLITWFTASGCPSDGVKVASLYKAGLLECRFGAVFVPARVVYITAVRPALLWLAEYKRVCSESMACCAGTISTNHMPGSSDPVWHPATGVHYPEQVLTLNFHSCNCVQLARKICPVTHSRSPLSCCRQKRSQFLIAGRTIQRSKTMEHAILPRYAWHSNFIDFSPGM